MCNSSIAVSSCTSTTLSWKVPLHVTYVTQCQLASSSRYLDHKKELVTFAIDHIHICLHLSCVTFSRHNCSTIDSNFNIFVLLLIQGAFSQKNALSTFCRVPNTAWKAIANEYNSKDNVSDLSVMIWNISVVTNYINSSLCFYECLGETEKHQAVEEMLGKPQASWKYRSSCSVQREETARCE